MKLAWRPYLLVGLAAYVIFMLALTPANLVYTLSKEKLDALSPPIKIYGLEGSVWSGRMQRLEYNQQSFNQLQWDLHPSGLLLGGVEASLAFNKGSMEFQGDVRRSFWGTMTISDVQGMIRASDLMAMVGMSAIKLEGDFALNLDQLTLKDKIPVSAQGTLTWNRAASRFPFNLDLGELMIEFEDVSEGVSAKLSDKGGPLEVAGDLLLKQDGNYQFNAVFVPRPGSNPQLVRTLMMMGPPNAQGKFEVKKQGNISQLTL